MRPPLRAPAEPPEGKTFLYVIQSLQYCKIGKAANLYIRLSNIRVDNPHSPVLIGYWPVPKDLADRIETMWQLAHGPRKPRMPFVTMWARFRDLRVN